MCVTVNLGRKYVGTGLAFLSRDLGPKGELLVQNDLASIDLKVVMPRQGNAAEEEITARTLSIATCVFDELQADDERWTTDGVGFNFLFESLATDLPADAIGRTVEFRFLLTPAEGQPWLKVLAVKAIGPSFTA